MSEFGKGQHYDVYGKSPNSQPTSRTGLVTDDA